MKKIILIGILAAIQTVAFGQTVPLSSDSGTASFEILSYDEEADNYEYKIVNVSYEHTKAGIVKYITTSIHYSNMGIEYSSRNIKVEFRELFDRARYQSVSP